MAIKPVLVYRNPDSTLDLNSRAARIIDRGIFDGGQLSPSALSLSVDVAPFIGVGFDGMVAISDATETLSVPAPAVAGPNQVSYLILHLEYRSLTTPIANLQVVPETTFLTSISRNFFISFARIEVPFGATSLQDPGVIIDYGAGDWAEKAGKAGWRSPVADFASLPVPTAGGPNLGNRDGDIRLTLDTYTLYAWDNTAGTWNPAGGALDLAEATARSDEHDSQILRSFNGSGLVSSTNNDFITFASTGGFDHYGPSGSTGTRVPFVTQNTLPNRVDVGPVHAVLNGHFVKTLYTELTLSAPAAGRYDLVFLEVWREALAGAVSAETYPNDPTVGGTSTFAQLRDNLEQLLGQFNTPNIGFGKIEAFDATTFCAVRWRIAVQDGVPATTLNNLLTGAASVVNIDGNAFGTASTQNDQRLWSAASITAIDGVSWAIPLFIVRRTLLEVGPANYIFETRTDDNNNRYVYDVSPRAELGFGMQETTGAASSATTGVSGIGFQKSASGFVRSWDAPLQGLPGILRIPGNVIRVRGAELAAGSDVDVSLPAPPATGSRRDLVVCEVELTIHPHTNTQWTGGSELVRYQRQGLRQPRWIGRGVAFALTSETDTPAAMVSAGYTQVSGDPGLWSRPALPEEDQGPLGSGVVYAIPIALVHRRNSSLTFAITPTQNQNGTISRPDGLTDATQPATKEILDLRHRVVESEADATAILQESLDKLARGELRTRLRTSPFSSDVAGTQVLAIDQLALAPSAGTHGITPAPQGSTTVWGDSDEAVLLTANFPSFDTGGLPVTDGSATPVFSWNGTAVSGTLTVTAPPGFVLNVEEGVNFDPVTDGAVLGPDSFTGVVGSSTDEARSVAPFGALAISLDSENNLVGFTSTSISLPVGSTSTSNFFVQVWARRPARQLAAYSSNGGLFEIPDRVHRVDFFDGIATTNEANVGPIVASVTATPVADEIVITQADLFAALGGAGNRFATAAAALRIYGALNITIEGASIFGATGPKVRFIDLTDAAATAPGFERMRIEFVAGTVLTDVTVTVAFAGDLINRWVVVTPTNRGFRGLYAWTATELNSTALLTNVAREAFPDVGATALPNRNHVVPMFDGGYQGSFLGAQVGDTEQVLSLTTNDAIIYARNATASTPQWRLWTDTADVDATNIGNLANSFRYGVVDFADYEGEYSAFVSGGYTNYPGFDISLLVVTPVRIPLTSTQSLTFYYDYTPYQGLSSDFPLAEKTTGKVVDVGPVWVHTLGTNLSWIHPRELAVDYTGEPRSSLDVGDIRSRGMDLQSNRRALASQAASVGADAPAVLNGSQIRSPYAGLTRRFPYPSFPSSLAFSETYIRNTLLLRTGPLTRRRTILPEEANGETIGALAGMDYFNGAWRATAINQHVYYPVIVPSGAEIFSFEVRADVNPGPGNLFVRLYRRDSTGNLFLLASDTVGFSSTNSLLWVPGILGGGSDRIAGETETFVLELESATAAQTYRVNQVVVYYSDPSSSLAAQGQRLLHFEVSSAGSGFAPLHKGALLENPWSPADFTALEAVYTVDGETTYGVVPRGRSSSLPIDVGAGPLSTISGGFFYYVPLSDLDSSQASSEVFEAFISLTAWPLSGSPYDYDLPRSFAATSHDFWGAHSPKVLPGGAGSQAFNSACGVLPYVIANNDGQLSLVVSQSSFSGGVASGSVMRAITGLGAALDAFYPVGRPVYIKDS